jgi:hypothetical protein
MTPLPVMPIGIIPITDKRIGATGIATVYRIGMATNGNRSDISPYQQGILMVILATRKCIRMSRLS